MAKPAENWDGTSTRCTRCRRNADSGNAIQIVDGDRMERVCIPCWSKISEREQWPGVERG